MTVFDLYAAYYDLLYRDKDYDGESEYVAGLVREYRPGAASILELGCGTGAHAVRLAQHCWNVHGVDLSPRMVEHANARREAASGDLQTRLTFEIGDVRSFRCGQTFDAVISLFHVMSYQAGNSDQEEAFRTARSHLSAGGLFVFDFWYGPAVLTDRPKHVVRQVEDQLVEVRRETTPVMDVNANCVDVHFDVLIRSRADLRSQRVSERHRMRYLFLPEIEQRLATHGFDLVSAHAWMSRRPLDDRSWYGCVVGRVA